MRFTDLVALGFLLHVIGITKGSCPDDWVQHRKSCYFLSNDTMNWFNSMDYCHKHGSYLAEIETQDETDFLKTQCLNRGWHNYWVGGMDKKEGDWVWMHSGRPFTFTFWNNREPNNERINTTLTEDCLQLRGGYFYSWNDWFCPFASRFICEKNFSESSAGPAIPVIGK